MLLALPALVVLLLVENSIHEARHQLHVGALNSRTLADGVDLSQVREDYKARKEALISEAAKQRKRGLEEEVDEVDEEALQREMLDVWPTWWGNVDQVGKSPFDYTPREKPPRRILFLTGKPAASELANA
jgi:hypothetical protein